MSYPSETPPKESPAGDGPSYPAPLPKEALPPVEPPTAGFLMQLFFIPLVIVSIIVGVWLMFGRLAQMGSRPDQLVGILERGDAGSWQSAKTLADVIRSPRSEELRHDTHLAGRLATLLEQQLELGESERYPNSSKREQEQVVQQVFLRAYLCRVLGEFEVTTGVPVLIEAAELERHPLEVKVRRAAVEGLTLLLSRVPSEEMASYEELLSVLRKATGERDDNEPILAKPRKDPRAMSLEEREEDDARWEAAEDSLRLRSTSVYALGLLGGPEPIELLDFMLGDPHPDVRANAATGLARHGDVRAIDMLVRMLDPEDKDVVSYEPEEASHDWKRSDVMRSAIGASLLLVEENPTSNEIDRLRQAVAELTEADVSKKVVIEAREALEQIDKLRTRPAS